MANVHYRSGVATKDDAPICLYGTCKIFSTRNYSDTNFNVTWSFDIDIGFQYLIRFHYCDIVSTTTYVLFFNVFVDSWMVTQILDLSALTKRQHYSYKWFKHGALPSFTIVQATPNNFDESLAIRTGGFDKVVVKRGHIQSQQGQNSFQKEILMLSRLYNHHLVSLIGYCDENIEIILIYEYMENGTVKSHLYMDLDILALNFLHTASPTLAIYRDIRSSNILLDENFKAKLVDFGLPKPETNLEKDHVTTIMNGNF
ncbi:Receptor-like protein kinase HERK 1 [Bienertia sinuspersici]